MAPSFVRETIAAMHGYTPGEQPAPGERVVKLNTNENPYPPTPKVLAAIRSLEGEHLRRYPNATADQLRDAAAAKWNLTRDHFIAGNGSDDLLTIATRTFVPPGGTLAAPDPTYSLYGVLAKLQEAKLVTVPWGDGYSLPMEELLALKSDAIFLANPNAPTGTIVPPELVAKLAGTFKGLVLVDEAYADFAATNCVHLVSEFSNVIVTRTFSKSYSLAGMRIGYAIGQPQVIAEMMKVKDSYNCDAVSIAAAAAALEDEEYARGIWETVRADRSRLTMELEKRGFAVLPSHGNFVLATVPSAMGHAKAVYQKLRQQGILVRYFPLPGLEDKLRITVGTSTEINALLAGLESLATAEKAA